MIGVGLANVFLWKYVHIVSSLQSKLWLKALEADGMLFRISWEIHAYILNHGFQHMEVNYLFSHSILFVQFYNKPFDLHYCLIECKMCIFVVSKKTIQKICVVFPCALPSPISWKWYFMKLKIRNNLGNVLASLLPLFLFVMEKVLQTASMMRGWNMFSMKSPLSIIAAKLVFLLVMH